MRGSGREKKNGGAKATVVADYAAALKKFEKTVIEVHSKKAVIAVSPCKFCYMNSPIMSRMRQFERIKEKNLHTLMSVHKL